MFFCQKSVHRRETGDASDETRSAYRPIKDRASRCRPRFLAIGYAIGPYGVVMLFRKAVVSPSGLQQRKQITWSS